MNRKPAQVLLMFAMACARLAHSHLLWADEDYHLAAAVNILHGKIPYRDFWYDKPPLNALYYVLIGAHWGWPLRLLDAAYILAACYLAYRVARDWWGEAEGWTAALLLAFFTTFYIPSAAIPFAPDALTIVPHLAAIFFARRSAPLWAGVFAGVALLVNTKAIFVVATCAAWLLPELAVFGLGVAFPVVVGLVSLAMAGAWPGYWEQVWHWGFIYAKGSARPNPLGRSLIRVVDWAGFHAALVVAGAFAWKRVGREDRWRLGVWLGLSFVSAMFGDRFAPRYFLQILPALVIIAARGMVLAVRANRWAATTVFAVLLLIPAIRFGPRYVSLAADMAREREPAWKDVALDLDSKHAAVEIASLARPGDTLFVWGYRPDVYVYTRMISGSRFGDSQPLTGVPADRHLSSAETAYPSASAANRKELARSHPTFIVDGLGLLNPRLQPAAYPELRPWLAQYRLVGHTSLSLIYRRGP